jgi:hypothetical protein
VEKFHELLQVEPHPEVQTEMAVAPYASLTWTVKEDVPAAVGVPLMTPVFVLSVSPGGSDPAMSEKT